MVNMCSSIWVYGIGVAPAPIGALSVGVAADRRSLLAYARARYLRILPWRAEQEAVVGYSWKPVRIAQPSCTATAERYRSEAVMYSEGLLMARSAHLDSPFVGRQRELSVLTKALDQAAQRQAGLALVEATAGYGKTWLVTEVLNRAGNDLLVMRGGCRSISTTEVDSPYGPFAEAVRRLPEDVPGWAEVMRWLDPIPQASTDPVETRQTEFLAILGGLAKYRPVALVLEDLQWADQSTVDLLIFLARNLSTERVLIIATTRGGGNRVKAFADLRRVPSCRPIEMGAMPDGDIRQLAVHSGVTPEQAATIARLAEGSPLLAREAAEWCLRGGEIGVPKSVSQAVQALLVSLSPTARAVVEVTAVIGTYTEWKFVRAVLAAEGGDLDAAIENCRELDLLVADGAGCSFRHALEQQAVYDRVLPGRREGLHRAVARQMESERPPSKKEWSAGQMAQIAVHWRLAGDRRAAAVASLWAGLLAYEVSAFPEALTHLEAGLREWPAAPEQLDGWETPWVDSVIMAAKCARGMGKLVRGIEKLKEALESASGGAVARLWDCIGRLQREGGRSEEAVAAYRQALAVGEGDTPPGDLAVIYAGYAMVLMTRFELGAAREYCEKALECAGADPSEARASALITLGVVHFMEGHEEDGLRLLDQGHRIATEIDSADEVKRYVGNVTFYLINAGRIEEAVDRASAELERARAVGLHRSAAVQPALINAVCGMVLLGRWGEAMQYAVDSLADDAAPGVAASMHLALAEIHALRGEREAATAALAAAKEGMKGIGEPEVIGHLHRIQAELSVWDLNLKRVRAAVQEGLGVPEIDADTRLQLIWVGLRAEADAAKVGPKDPERLRRLELALKEAEAPAARWKASTPIVAACRAELKRARNQHDPAAWREIAERWDTMRNPYQYAYAKFREAEAYARRAYLRARLEAALTAAARQAAALGAAPLLDLIRLTAQQRKVDLPDLLEPPVPSPPEPLAVTRYGLTNREMDVLRHLLDFMSNYEIAMALGTKVRTITTHLTSIYRKLGVDGREAALQLNMHVSLLEPPGQNGGRSSFTTTGAGGGSGGGGATGSGGASGMGGLR